jgi:hypothetical protein
MDFEPTPRQLEGVTASNRIARREALLRIVEGHGKSRVIISGILALAAAIYVGWEWPVPQSLITWVLLSLIWELHIQTSRRFAAVAEFLREERSDRTEYRR